jgi:hypothetical protein
MFTQEALVGMQTWEEGEQKDSTSKQIFDLIPRKTEQRMYLLSIGLYEHAARTDSMGNRTANYSH